ncbi:MAG: polyphosphate:AMP phosphotransferase [Lachnospiraceae bacterium]|nr:polyphosphate:AMP phosphotransferase [Lachnospiraceae bacterium]
MLEKIDLKKKCSGKDYKEKLEAEAERLSLLQRKCKEAGIPVIIVFEGFGAAGKGTQINRLIQAMDPRGFSVYTSNRETEEERMRPFLWRYWTKIPAKGRFTVFDRSWYRRVLVDRFDKITKKEELPNAFHDILSFERQLADDGTVIIKFFLYISKEEQKKRFKNLEESKETAWKVTEADWKRNKEYDEYLKINEEMLEKTDTDYAPWVIVEAMDKNYAALKIISSVTARLEQELAKRAVPGEKKQNEKPVMKEDYKSGVLSGVDLTKTLSNKDYKKKLDELQKKMEILHSELYRLRIPVVICFEGWDAAGKGGAIKRLTSHMDPRGYQVNPTASPNDTEKAHHYLWRFWNNMPKAGHIAIFDRTWYGRVMVERIEGFCSEEEWKRAYQEINEMEEHLTNSGCVVLKLWLHIDKDEQERRFKERMENPAKQWKITDEDWRNREKWDEYEKAVDEMLVRTSTTYAPWEIVEANSKYYARVKVLETVVEAMEKAIDASKR